MEILTQKFEYKTLISEYIKRKLGLYADKIYLYKVYFIVKKKHTNVHN